MACSIAESYTLMISPPCRAIQATMKVAGSEELIGGDVRRRPAPRMYREGVGVLHATRDPEHPWCNSCKSSLG